METPEMLAFHVSWDASGTGDIKELIMIYYTSDSTLELRKPQSSTLHLKRVKVPRSLTKSFFVGAQLVVFSRHLRIVDIANKQTQAYLQHSMEPVICIWRASDPQKYSDELQILLDSGLILTNCKLLSLEGTLGDYIRSCSPGFSMTGEISVMSASAVACFVLRGEQASKVYEQVFKRGAHTSDHVLVCLEHLVVIPALLTMAVNPFCIGGTHLHSKSYRITSLFVTLFSGFRVASKSAELPEVLHSQGNEAPSTVEQLALALTSKAADTTFNVVAPEVTCCVIKPHALQHTGLVLREILTSGLSIGAMQSFRLTNLAAMEFLEVYKTVLKEYPQMVEELTNGTVVALQLEGPDAVSRLRRLAGPYDPEVGRCLHPATLRARLGADVARNALHCTDLQEDGPLECSYFFQLVAGAASTECIKGNPEPRLKTPQHLGQSDTI
ncbi:nucleoside diphosphate kinase 7 [Cyclospora cayetanensis]|uniref:Nucleoside diphosphate kinase 7 n=2 Tax=Cyclospora cayetanensis TaxID=88456 RepID=A0A6P5WDN6_9EIME|nr:nucleoside diphosphate kinase 7 [Cyclospora cayetanensis]OEH78523.1 nucleoside diphosphate kinase [Cyclospora cayetanensis]